MRKLATIQRILDINPIPDADAIERVTVKGWNVVSQKGIHKVGNLAIYIEIDSLLPIHPEFEFLRKTSYRQFKDGTEGFVLSTVRMRGQVSQGLLLPLDVLGNFCKYSDDDIVEGNDVSELLGITKYEEPIPDEILAQAKGMRPSYVPSTSQERAQNSQPLIDRYAGQLFIATEKLDGWSASYYLHDNVFGVTSSGVDFKDLPENPYWQFAHRVNLEERLRDILKEDSNIVLQGELVGPGIRGNKYDLKEKTVFFYNVRNHEEKDISPDTLLIFLNQLSVMRTYPLLEQCPVISAQYLLPETVDALVADASIKSRVNPNIWAEGIVLRHKVLSHDHNGRVSLKVINPNFLLKYKD